MRLKHQRKGFGVIELVIIVAVIAVIAGLGWYALKGKSPQQTSSSTPSSTTTPANTAAPTPDPYTDWQTYTGRGFTVKYPAAWKYIDTMGDRADLSSVVFGEDIVAAQGGSRPGTSAFDVMIFHKGYKICDCNPAQYVGDNTDLTHFIRAMNGLLPDDSFSQVQKQTKTIDGVEALKYKGGNYDTNWTMKVGSNIYQFDGSQNLQPTFDMFFASFHIK